MKQTVFYLEGRGGMYLYHFFVYNLGGLWYIINKNYNIRIPNTSVLLDDKSKIMNEPTTEIKFPIKIHMKNVLPFQREAFEMIKDKFELVENLDTLSDYEIVSIYGETVETNHYSDNPKKIFPFLRNLFLEKMNYQMVKGKRIFITRKNSESQHNGVLKRFILNENELMLMLNKYDFEYIQLENYNSYEKIKLFMESEIVISTHGSQLTFTLFSNKETKIIEIINKANLDFNCHTENICKELEFNYNRYSNINEDYNGNFYLNTIDFEKYLLNIL